MCRLKLVMSFFVTFVKATSPLKDSLLWVFMKALLLLLIDRLWWSQEGIFLLQMYIKLKAEIGSVQWVLIHHMVLAEFIIIKTLKCKKLGWLMFQNSKTDNILSINNWCLQLKYLCSVVINLPSSIPMDSISTRGLSQPLHKMEFLKGQLM